MDDLAKHVFDTASAMNRAVAEQVRGEPRVEARSDHEAIGRFLADPRWTTGEKWIIKWQFGLLGDFNTALVKAITLADESNLERLQVGFPIEVNAFVSWQRGNLSERLRTAGLEI